MKRCPSCQRSYPDDAPAFCVNDGTRLVDEEPSPEYDPMKTIMASAPPPNPTPPPQYSNPAPPPINQPSAPIPAPPQPIWPPQPPPGQNWGGGYYPQGQGYAQPPKSKGLSTAALIIGALSGLLGLLLLLDYLRVIRMLTKDTAIPILIAAIATGGVAIILGLIALFSSRQRGKVMAIIGIVLSAFSIGFWIYLEAEYGIFF